MQNKRRLIVLALLIIVILLCGCWDNQDINNKSIVISIGVDSIGEDYILQYEIINTMPVKTKQADKGADEPDTYILEGRGKTFSEAHDEIIRSESAELFFGGCKLLIVGGNYAINNNILEFLSRVDGLPGYQRNMAIIYTEDLNAFFDATLNNDISKGLFVDNMLLASRVERTQYFPYVFDILSESDRGHQSFLLPVYTIREGGVFYDSIAVFKDGTYVGKLSKDEIQGSIYMLHNRTIFTTEISFIDDDGKQKQIGGNIKVKNKGVKTDFIDGRMSFTIKLKAELILDYTSENHVMTEKETDQVFEQAIEEKIEAELWATINATRNIYQCDFLGLEDYFSAYSYKDYQQIDYDALFVTADFYIEVEAETILNKAKEMNQSRGSL
jgi:spore germination protein KC